MNSPKFYVRISIVSAVFLSGCIYIPVQPDSAPENESLIIYPDEDYSTTTSAPENESSNADLNRSAVVDLIDKSDWHFRAGSYAKAESVLERAMRLDSGNANIWYRLAKIKLAKGNPGEAERMAEKSNALARHSVSQQTANWLLIAEARRLSGDESGAMAAEAQAHGAGFK